MPLIRSADRGLMIVLDASVLFEIVADTPRSDSLRMRLAQEDDQSAPHLIDAEVLYVIQSRLRHGDLDNTAATQAIEDLRTWPGERWSHQALLLRAWELRHNIRGYDALYVALAEGLGATLLTLDTRLSRAAGIRCPIEVPSLD
ncbi:MAG: type II toxin-antitoxin system VapC family toxin [Microthrixaceae bacterium]